MGGMTGGYIGWGVYGTFTLLLGLLTLVLWVFLMVKAYQNENFKLPMSGADFAEGIANK